MSTNPYWLRAHFVSVSFHGFIGIILFWEEKCVTHINAKRKGGIKINEINVLKSEGRWDIYKAVFNL